MAQRECVFCGARANSREHAWPRWLRQSYPNVAQMRIVALAGQSRRVGGKPELTVADRRSYQGAPFDIRVRQVCSVCNGGWMSDLEMNVRPFLEVMLRGERLTLDVENHRILAA